jgi:hypothetical protein
MARARPLDAPVVDELVEQTEYPSRDFTVADPHGNHWTFATFAAPHERAELGHDCSQKHRQVNPVNTPPGPSRSTPCSLAWSTNRWAICCFSSSSRSTGSIVSVMILLPAKQSLGVSGPRTGCERRQRAGDASRRSRPPGEGHGASGDLTVGAGDDSRLPFRTRPGHRGNARVDGQRVPASVSEQAGKHDADSACP